MKPTENLQLIRPSVEWETAHQKMMQDWQSQKTFAPFVLDYDQIDFETYVNRLNNEAIGVGLPDGWVKHSTFWLINENQELVGVSNMRHELTPKLLVKGGNIGYGIAPSHRNKGYATQILALTLLEAKKLGMSKALLTCDSDNVYSAKTIIRNGGQLWKEHLVEGVPCQNYWIEIA